MGIVKDFKFINPNYLQICLTSSYSWKTPQDRSRDRWWRTEVITKDKISNFRRRLKLCRGPGAESRMVAPGGAKEEGGRRGARGGVSAKVNND